MTVDQTPPALEVEDLHLALIEQPDVEILRGVSLSVAPGERVGLVGESGSGKSMLSLAAMGLLPSAVGYASGAIRVDGMDVVRATDRQLAAMRGSRVSMIYQDPMSSLNPVKSVGMQIAEAVRVHQRVSRRDARRFAVQLLGDVGVASPERASRQYPHEFSGGMRQRVMIAMAVSCRPGLLLADEPTTALDVTTQARIIDLLSALVDSRGMGVVFVTHDLAVAAAFCDRIVVMRHGQIVEAGATRQILNAPTQAYTRQLVESIIGLDTDVSRPIGAGAFEEGPS